MNMIINIILAYPCKLIDGDQICWDERIMRMVSSARSWKYSSSSTSVPSSSRTAYTSSWWLRPNTNLPKTFSFHNSIFNNLYGKLRIELIPYLYKNSQDTDWGSCSQWLPNKTEKTPKRKEILMRASNKLKNLRR